MPIPGSNDDGTMIADLAQFDLLNEIVEADQQKPWASGYLLSDALQEAGFSGRSNLHGSRGADQRTSRRWHQLSVRAEGTYPLQHAGTGI
jgi:hypothetical protein